MIRLSLNGEFINSIVCIVKEQHFSGCFYLLAKKLKSTIFNLSPIKR